VPKTLLVHTKYENTVLLIICTLQIIKPSLSVVIIVQISNFTDLFTHISERQWRPMLTHMPISLNSTWLARHVSTRLDTFDVSSVSSRAVMADDEQAIVLGCTSLVVFMLLHTQILFVS